MSERTHDVLKEYLLELGRSVKDFKGKPYYRVYSGDSEPIDIRLGKKHIEYLPDVVWERKGRPLIIEIALNEDWRSIVGEMTLASLAKGCSAIFIIATNWDDEYLNNLMSIIGNKLGVYWYYIILDEKDLKDLEVAKRNIKVFMKQCDLI
ncbi:MAG: hypothetical protein QXQ94_08230 [Candidatus Bathyarchaeia archaeon]